MNSPTIQIFGIPERETLKKSRKWLDAHEDIGRSYLKVPLNYFEAR